MSHRVRRAVRGGLLALVLASVAVTVPASFRREGRVDPFESETWTVWTSTGETRVTLKGGGETDLDCYVRDRSGRLLGKDDGRTDDCHVAFVRRTSGNVEIRVVNLGDRQNRYELLVH